MNPRRCAVSTASSAMRRSTMVVATCTGSSRRTLARDAAEIDLLGQEGGVAVELEQHRLVKILERGLGQRNGKPQRLIGREAQPNRRQVARRCPAGKRQPLGDLECAVAAVVAQHRLTRPEQQYQIPSCPGMIEPQPRRHAGRELGAPPMKEALS